MATTQLMYSDIPVNFDVHPIKGDLIPITNVDSVKRALRNLLLTDPYERFFNPSVGSGIRASLFENVDRESEFFLKERITDVITNYEPRVNLYSVNVNASPDENAYLVNIVFYLVDNTTPVTLNLVLYRVR